MGRKQVAFVYCVTNAINMMQYIGFTNKTPEQRLELHIKGQCAASLLHEAIIEFGVENFTLETVFTGTYTQALKKERYFIKKFNTKAPNGYNQTNGGDAPMLGKTHTIEARAKVGKANKYRVWTTEARAKISIAHKGKQLSSEHRAKISIAHKGKLLSSEHRAKLKAAAIEQWRDPETRIKCSRVWTPETRAKISAAHRGKKPSPETRAKISASLIGNKRRHKAALRFKNQ